MTIDKDVIKIISNARSVVFFTGAGISAESGIPTFRGKDGIWNKLRPEELANFDAFMRNPKLVWEWYKHRMEIVHKSEPNAGHLAIAEMQNMFDKVTVVTQNIDNLHIRAGSKTVYELHGNIERNYCVKCKQFFNKDFDISKGAPMCKCGGLIRPDVVWFGEYLPEDQFTAGDNAARQCDLFFIVGTSGVVYPAASLIFTAKNNGATLIEINIEPTEVCSSVNYSLYGKSGSILPELIKLIKDFRDNKD
ncbi:MAG: NAD-dependent deacylase [Ignavibacteriaceae bacterium]|nr:NAD-dependent deacylase [Ignavibacteriaceae bacterium]